MLSMTSMTASYATGNTGTLSGTCRRCRNLYNNPVKHAVFYCGETEKEREVWWDWIMDSLHIEVASYLNQLDDDQVLQLLLGDVTVITLDISS